MKRKAGEGKDKIIPLTGIKYRGIRKHIFAKCNLKVT